MMARKFANRGTRICDNPMLRLVCSSTGGDIIYTYDFYCYEDYNKQSSETIESVGSEKDTTE